MKCFISDENLLSSKYCYNNISNNTVEYKLNVSAKTDARDICFGIFDNPQLDFSNSFVMVPAAVYNGNKFPCEFISYPPMIPKSLRTKEGIVFSNDIPRIEDDGENLLEHRLGSGSSPLLAIWEKDSSNGIIYTYSPINDGTPYTESGFRIKNSGEIEFCYPLVRKKRYRFSLDWSIGGDKYATLRKNEKMEFSVKKTSFNCNSVEELYQAVLNLRYSENDGNEADGLPLSEVFNTIAEKFDRENWSEEHGCYKTAPYGDNLLQTGWAGTTFLPYIFRNLKSISGKERNTRMNRHTNYIFKNAQAKSGFFYSALYKDEIQGDDFENLSDTSIHLVRRSADMLYSFSALFLSMREKGEAVPALWNNGIKKCADAFISLWKNEKDLGFYVNVEDGSLIMGGTHSGSMAIAGLVLASEYFENSEYLSVALEIADKYYNRFLEQGFTNGGPAEALTTPDSESAYALFEGMVILYEKTCNKKYLEYAKVVANYVATWVIDYNYPFPKESLFGKLNKKSRGAVWANLQNKHGAPGFATHCGSAFLRLYFYTGEKVYLKIITDVSRSVTQFMSHPDNRLYDFQNEPLNDGYICERVNTSDWENFDFIGSLYKGSNWCELSAMMCYTDMPGVIWNKDNNEVTTLDNVKAYIEDGKLVIKNHTKYDIKVKVLELRDGFIAENGDITSEFKEIQMNGGQTISMFDL